jgi:hypothetical protein
VATGAEKPLEREMRPEIPAEMPKYAEKEAKAPKIEAVRWFSMMKTGSQPRFFITLKTEIQP